jgi:hypothetical protein
VVDIAENPNFPATFIESLFVNIETNFETMHSTYLVHKFPSNSLGNVLSLLAAIFYLLVALNQVDSVRIIKAVKSGFSKNIF